MKLWMRRRRRTSTVNSAKMSERMSCAVQLPISCLLNVRGSGFWRKVNHRQLPPPVPRDAFRVEKKGVSVEAHWVDKTRENHRPDREESAVLLGRQTNRPKDNKKWKGLIENSG